VQNPSVKHPGLPSAQHGVFVASLKGKAGFSRKQIKIADDHILDVHQCLAQYPHSSYHYYVRKYGIEFLTDAWMRYPILDYFEHDDF
jgi:molybdate-binding protein